MCFAVRTLCICGAHRGLRHTSDILLCTAGKSRSGTAAIEAGLAWFSGRGRGNKERGHMTTGLCSM